LGGTAAPARTQNPRSRQIQDLGIYRSKRRPIFVDAGDNSSKATTSIAHGFKGEGVKDHNTLLRCHSNTHNPVTGFRELVAPRV
jgi:hypothetical protein